MGQLTPNTGSDNGATRAGTCEIRIFYLYVFKCTWEHKEFHEHTLPARLVCFPLFFLIYFLLKRHRLCYETMSQSFFFSSSRVVYLIVSPDPFPSVNKELECDFLHKLPDKHTPLSPELLHCSIHKRQFTQMAVKTRFSSINKHYEVIFLQRNICQSRYGE